MKLKNIVSLDNQIYIVSRVFLVLSAGVTVGFFKDAPLYLLFLVLEPTGIIIGASLKLLRYKVLKRVLCFFIVLFVSQVLNLILMNSTYFTFSTWVIAEAFLFLLSFDRNRIFNLSYTIISSVFSLFLILALFLSGEMKFEVYIGCLAFLPITAVFVYALWGNRVVGNRRSAVYGEVLISMIIRMIFSVSCRFVILSGPVSIFFIFYIKILNQVISFLWSFIRSVEGVSLSVNGKVHHFVISLGRWIYIPMALFCISPFLIPSVSVTYLLAAGLSFFVAVEYFLSLESKEEKNIKL